MSTRGILVLAVLLATAGCGFPASGHLDRIDSSSVPFHLLSPAPTASAAAEANGPATSIYLMRGDRLTTVQRRVVGENVPAEAVRLLLEGPDGTEAARGLTTDIPARTRLISLDLTGPVATVDLSSEFGTLGGSEQVAAVAQLVYTLTASRFIDSVRFAINGEPTEVPDGSGSLAATPRTRANYRHLAPAG